MAEAAVEQRVADGPRKAHFGDPDDFDGVADADDVHVPVVGRSRGDKRAAGQRDLIRGRS